MTDCNRDISDGVPPPEQPPQRPPGAGGRADGSTERSTGIEATDAAASSSRSSTRADVIQPNSTSEMDAGQTRAPSPPSGNTQAYWRPVDPPAPFRRPTGTAAEAPSVPSCSSTETDAIQPNSTAEMDAGQTRAPSPPSGSTQAYWRPEDPPAPFRRPTGTAAEAPSPQTGAAPSPGESHNVTTGVPNRAGRYTTGGTDGYTTPIADGQTFAGGLGAHPSGNGPGAGYTSSPGTSYAPGAWQLPPEILQAAAKAAQPPKRSRKYWERFVAGVRRMWRQLVSSLVVRIVCNGAVSALAGLIATAIVSAILNVNGGFSFLFFTAVTLLVFIKMTNHTMAYVKNIAEAVGKISAGDYTVKVPEKYSDELGTLARQINQMTVELSRAREREQLEEQRKNEFITSIAHDLRTPLTSVIGYLGLISEQDGQPVDKETLVRYADVAFRKSKRLEQLIGQLFDFSRYNFGEIHPADSRIDLAELIEQINQEFYPQFAERHLESRVIITGRPVYVKGDGSMLARVFDNILGNAVRYGAAGRYIDIELYNRGAEAVARVTNYGAEISPEDLTRIFDKFYRTDASRSSGTGGAGLGMAIAKNIVEAHGGSIRAFSGDGRVTFEVVLPVAPR